jgi:hypothetical protein
MTVIKSTVAKSNDIRDAALNINLKAYEVRRTLAAVWDLKPTGTAPPAPAEAFSLDMKNESGESVVGDDDGRVRVQKAHFSPGGKYRCKSFVFNFAQIKEATRNKFQVQYQVSGVLSLSLCIP